MTPYPPERRPAWSHRLVSGGALALSTGISALLGWALFAALYPPHVAKAVAAALVLAAALGWVSRGLARAALRPEAALVKPLLKALERLPAGVILTDDEGGALFYNRAARALTGGAAPAALDLRRRGEPCPPGETPLARAAAAGEVTAADELLVASEGKRLAPILASAAPAGDTPESRAALFLFQDISRLKELERQREEWASVVVHELRQPLSVINLAAAVLLQGRACPRFTERALKDISVSACRLGRMIGDLSDLSQLEAERLILLKREIEPVALACEVIERAADTLLGREVRLVAPPELPPLSADPDRIEQVLANLLSNAAKYGEPGEIALRIERRGEETWFSVENRGAGIPEDELPALFSRFYRTRAARQERRVKGTGLGLYICKGLVEAHGGRIWVESVPGGQTAFTFALPSPAPAAEAEGDLAPEGSAGFAASK